MTQVVVISIPNGKGRSWGRALICTAEYPSTFLVEEPVLRMILEAVASLAWRRN